MSVSDAETRAMLLRALRTHGAVAINDMAAEASEVCAADVDTNTLSWLGNRASYHLRRALLLEALKTHGWNLTQTAAHFGIAGAGALSRTIRDLGLSREYDAARKRGAGKPGPKTKKEATK